MKKLDKMIRRQMNADTKYGFKRYQFMVDAPFKVSEKCCDIMKKKPAKAYHKKTGLCPYVGTRADESTIRADNFQLNGENNFDKPIPSSQPLSIWTEEDVWNYIHWFQLPYSTIYDKGVARTGCIFCMFGITMDRHRFLNLKATHPKQWAYCMRERVRRFGHEGGAGLHRDSYRMLSDNPNSVLRG